MLRDKRQITNKKGHLHDLQVAFQDGGGGD